MEREDVFKELAASCPISSVEHGTTIGIEDEREGESLHAQVLERVNKILQ